MGNVRPVLTRGRVFNSIPVGSLRDRRDRDRFPSERRRRLAAAPSVSRARHVPISAAGINDVSSGGHGPRPLPIPGNRVFIWRDDRIWRRGLCASIGSRRIFSYLMKPLHPGRLQWADYNGSILTWVHFGFRFTCIFMLL